MYEDWKMSMMCRPLSHTHAHRRHAQPQAAQAAQVERDNHNV